MGKIEVPSGTVHKMPPDLKRVLLSNPKALKAWEDITPLARNEWICWNITVKRPETRKNHIKRTIAELQKVRRCGGCSIENLKNAIRVISYLAPEAGFEPEEGQWASEFTLDEHLLFNN
jgi:hypothetical protein